MRAADNGVGIAAVVAGPGVPTAAPFSRPILRSSSTILPFILGDSYINELTRFVLLDPVPDKTVTGYVLRSTQALPSFQKVQHQAIELEGLHLRSMPFLLS